MNSDSPLASYQTAFKQFLFKEEQESDFLFSNDGFVPQAGLNAHSDLLADRLNIYRNNVYYSLTQALASLYPVVTRLVGENFFQMLTKAYVRKCPPENPIISLYGEYFAEFISEQTSCQALPYLADVAMLEWNCHQALHARDDAELDMETMAGFSEEQLACLYFSLQSSARLVRSNFPIDKILLENQKAEVATIDLTENTETFLLVYRKDFKVYVVALKIELYRLLVLLESGVMISEAWATLQQTSRLTDNVLPEMVAYLLGLAVFSDASLEKK